MEPSRRAIFNDMLDTVVKLAQGRSDMLRFAAYSTGDETKLVADFNASKADFDKQVKAIRAVKQNTQIYRTRSTRLPGWVARRRTARRWWFSAMGPQMIRSGVIFPSRWSRRPPTRR